MVRQSPRQCSRIWGFMTGVVWTLSVMVYSVPGVFLSSSLRLKLQDNRHMTRKVTRSTVVYTDIPDYEFFFFFQGNPFLLWCK